MAAPAARGSGGAVRVIANGEVYRQLFEDEARWVRSLGAARRGRLRLHEDLGSSAGTGPSPCNGRKETVGAKLLLGREATASQVSWKSEDVLAAEEVRALPDLVEVPEESRGNLLELVSERRRGRHGAALTSMHRELACVAREIEPFVLEPGELLLTKLMESDRKMDVLTKMELDATLEGFSIEDLEELWMTMQQESLTRKEWVREWNETLKKVEWSRADKITDVLRKYTAMLEEISFLSSADVHRLINDEAMMINRALLANQRAIAKLFFNLMKSEMKRELSLQLKWRDRVKDWRLIRKNCIIQSFREFMAKEEIQDPQMVKIEMENMMSGQILLNERRLELLQHLTDLLPPASTQAEINEWYSSLVDLNRSIDAHNMQCTMKIRAQYESVEQKCLAEAQLCKNNLLNLKVCTQEEAEEMVASDFLLLTEKLRCRFEEELEHMIRGFEELAKCNKQNCGDLYSYCQEASVLWDIHQLKLSQLEGELQKKLDECRWKQDKSIQMMETNLAIILDKMRTASSEKNLKKSLKNALSSLDGIRAEYEASNKVLMEEVTSYPEAILQELISYSESLSQYFNVKEIFKQNLEGKIDSMFPGQAEVLEAENPGEQQTESVVQENEEKQKADSCQQQNERTNIPENEKVFAQESEEREEQEDGESALQGSSELDDIEQGMTFPEDTFNSSKVGISELAVETFSTSSGNTYTVLGAEEAGKPDVLETHLTKYDEKGSLPMYLEHVLIKETVFVELKKRVRLCFFEHLEKWFAESLSNLWATVGAKKEELSSELRQHLLSCELRQENIETNIYNVRAEELLLHKKCLEHHCHEVGEALKKERAEFLRFCDQQNDSIQNLDSRIRDMEPAFLRAPVAEQLDSSSSSVCPELLHHLDIIRVSLRSYRNYLEETLGKLRDSNVDFLKGCRLFVEGGNFSPEEVQSFSKRLQKESKHIDSLEKLIVADMEKMESSCLEQATEVINQAETRFHCLFMNRVFMEKIQRLLTNLRVQIKSEVANSNVQAAALKSCLEKLCAFAHPTADEESLTSEELYDFIKVVIKELKARSQYLDCLLVNATIPYDNEHFAPPAAEVTLQGPIAAAIRAENKLRMMGLDPVRFPLLNPSRMGKSAIDDLSVSVIKNLLGIQSSRRKSSGLNQDSSDSLGPAILPTQKKSSHLNVPDEGPQRSDAYKHAARNTKKMATEKRTSRGSMQKCTRSVLSDKRFQIFGEKPPESNTFKGIVMNILWTGNNNLLCLAEEFYHKEKHQITMPEDLPETFERCAEVLRQNLLSYQSQIDDYYNSCLKEFWDQLKLFEEELPYVSQLAVDALLKEHEQKLSCATSNIQHSFNQQLEDWRSTKAAHKKELRPSLGHPDNSLQLEALCQRESKLQKDHVDAIHLHTRMLRDRAAQCAQNFVSALAAFTEKLLLELDESITIDDIQVPKTETLREKTSTLIHRKQAGLPLQTCEAEQLVERGSRTWPGIPMTTLVDDSDCITFRETASVTTAKTTLGHIAAVEARDAVYKKYIGKLEQQFAQIKEESTSQLVTIQRWENWWNQSIQKIKQLYT